MCTLRSAAPISERGGPGEGKDAHFYMICPRVKTMNIPPWTLVGGQQQQQRQLGGCHFYFKGAKTKTLPSTSQKRRRKRIC